jgi:hypothetical protein
VLKVTVATGLYELPRESAQVMVPVVPKYKKETIAIKSVSLSLCWPVRTVKAVVV